jgi:hypothetical protein
MKQEDARIKVCLMTAFKAYYNAMKEEHSTLNVRCSIKKPIEVKDLLFIVTNQLELFR